MNTLNIASISAVLISISACTSSPLSSISPSIDMRSACSTAVTNYALSRDAKDAEQYADVFAGDAVFTLPGGRQYSGQEEIKTYITALPEDAKSIHHVTTIHFQQSSPAKGAGTVYSFVQLWDETADGEKSNVKSGTGIYQDIYVLEGNTCRISRRDLSIPILQ